MNEVIHHLPGCHECSRELVPCSWSPTHSALCHLHYIHVFYYSWVCKEARNQPTLPPAPLMIPTAAATTFFLRDADMQTCQMYHHKTSTSDTYCLNSTWHIFMSPVIKIPQYWSLHVPHRPFIAMAPKPCCLGKFSQMSDLVPPTWSVLSSPHPDNSGCIAWLCSLQTAAVCPSDHSRLCLFWQSYF